MLASVLPALRGWGVASQDIRHEAFGPASGDVPSTSTQPPSNVPVVSTAAFAYTVFHDNDGGFVGLTDPVGSDGNVLADPLMVDPEAGDFTLTAASPAVDAGDPTGTDPDGSRADAGAFGGVNGYWTP
jgi:hypothetical protein